MKKVSLLLFLCLLAFAAEGQNFLVQNLLYNGPSQNRINIVILADGYQAQEMTKFQTDAQLLTDKIFETPPFSAYQSFFNVYAIEVPSAESGASHPNTAPDCAGSGVPVLSRNTYFGSTFDVGNTHRSLTAQNVTAIYDVLQNHFPEYDQIIVLVNTPYYGGTGGDFSTVSANANAPEIAIHELGHSFARLGDEYGSDGAECATLPGWMETPNTTAQTDPAKVRWKHWIDFPAPSPTPFPAFCDQVGVFEGAAYCDAGYYRPRCECKMRELYKPFCEICAERIIMKTHEKVKIIESFSPLSVGMVEPGSIDSVLFSTQILYNAPATLRRRWFLNDSLIAQNIDSLRLPSALKGGQYVLRFEAKDTTPSVRLNLPTRSLTWQFTVRQNPTERANPLAAQAPYPNPSRNGWTRLLLLQPANLRATNALGQTVWQKNNANGKIEIPTAHWPAGTYTLTLETDGRHESYPLMIEK